MVVKCEVRFDNNPTGTYFSGQVVSGKVDIILDKPKKVQGIAIRICGFANAHWSKTKTFGTGNNRKNSAAADTHYYGREAFISSTTNVAGMNDGINKGKTVDLNPGIHTYNFACALPSALPSSFEGTYGHIRYLVKVILNQPWKFDQTYVVGFTVLKSVDLNYDSPVLRMPHESVEQNQVWCGLCNSKPVSISLSIPQTGYVSGQLIAMEANIVNSNNVLIKDIQFGLRKIITYHSHSPTEEEYDEVIYVAKRNIGELRKDSPKRFLEFLIIPPVPPTSTLHSKIIHIKYEVELLTMIPGFHRDFRITCPITIGTVPLVGVIQQQPTTQNSLFDSTSSVLPVMNPLKSSTPSSAIPPPSYEEAIHMKRVNLAEEDDSALEAAHFVPRYPVYRFTESCHPSAPNISELGFS